MRAEILSGMLSTSSEFIEVSRKMLQCCIRKKNKLQTDARYILSFFFRRAIEIFESSIILIKENRLADSALLLRSFWEMGFSSAYIFENEKEKDHRALLFRLKEMEERKKFMEANIERFRKFDSHIETKKKILSEIAGIKRILSERWPGHKEQQFPNIIECAKLSGSAFLNQAYDQFYRFYSNIDHHSPIFGRDYVDDEKCEPLEKIRVDAVLRPETSLLAFKFIFLVILKIFNDEFRLNWRSKIAELEAIQKAEDGQMMIGNK